MLNSPQGVTKTYRLTYEAVEVSHALFDQNNAPYGWSVNSRLMREYIEYFGAKTEQLDLQVRDNKAIFTSFTEKIIDGKGMEIRAGIRSCRTDSSCRNSQTTVGDSNRSSHPRL